MSKTKPKKERSIQKCLFFFYFKNNHTMSHAAFLKHLHLGTYSTQRKIISKIQLIGNKEVTLFVKLNR